MLVILSVAMLIPAVSAIPQQVKSNLEVLEIKFEPIQQGKNVVQVKIKNNAPRDQSFAIHIYTRSPDYGRGVGWGTQFFETLNPHETKWARFGFKIYGPITDGTRIALSFYNPDSSETFDPKKYFDRKNFTSQDLEHRTILQKPVASPPKNLADEVIKAFRQVQTSLSEKKYEEAWESFTKDCQTIDFFNQGAALFKDLIEGDSVYKPFFWQIDIFLKLAPEFVIREDQGLKLRAVSGDQDWTIDFAREDGRWKIDWVGGYKPQVVLWADWPERLLPKMQKHSSGHFDIYYNKGSTAEREINKIVEEREKGYQEMSNFFDKSGDIRVRVVFFEDGKTKTWETGHRGAGWAFDQTIVEVYNEKEKLDPYHELCHILARPYGDPPALFNEGLAVYMTERLGAPALKSLGGNLLTVDEKVKKLTGENQWIPLKELITYTEIGSDESKPSVSYPEAASFVHFLIETFGKEKFLQAYRSLKNSSDKSILQENQKTLAAVYGRSLSELEKQWEAAIFEGN
jgi:hypothetical protein